MTKSQPQCDAMRVGLAANTIGFRLRKVLDRRSDTNILGRESDDLTNHEFQMAVLKAFAMLQVEIVLDVLRHDEEGRSCLIETNEAGAVQRRPINLTGAKPT